MTVSRRTVLLGCAAGLVAALDACSRAVRPAAGRSPTRTTADSPQAAPPARSATTSSSQPASAPPTSSERRPRRAVPAVQVAHGRRTRQEVALTFHGQGDPAIAHELLAIFAEHSASITVMAVGTWLAEYPHMAKAIVSPGHELGNHTYHHWDIDSLDPDQARAEIVRCRDLLTTLVGSPGAHFRQSQARTATPTVLKLAGAAGYPVCLSYDVDSLDYTDPGAATVRRNVRRARPGSIVSLHFGHPDTVAAMPGILADLADRGLRPVTAERLLRP